MANTTTPTGSTGVKRADGYPQASTKIPANFQSFVGAMEAMRSTQSQYQGQAMVIGDLGVPDRRNCYDFAASDYPIQSVGGMCSIANILDQLEPSELRVVTGLSPIMELSSVGNVFAITYQGGRQRSTCFLCWNPGHIYHECRRLTEEKRAEFLVLWDVHYRTKPQRTQKERFGGIHSY